MQHVPNDSLRRLHLAAQHGETLFFMMRPLAAARNPSPSPSPAPLRLSVRPALGGIDIGFVKRQGPQREESLFLPLSAAPAVRLLPQRKTSPVYTPATTSPDHSSREAISSAVGL